MSLIRIKQLSSDEASLGSVIAFNGQKNVWVKTNHVSKFSSSDLVDDVLIVDHELGRKYVNAVIFDENDEVLTPDKVKVIDDTTLHVYLSSFSEVIDNWTVLVS